MGGVLIKLQKFMKLRQYTDMTYFAKGCNWWSISHDLATALVWHEKEIIRKYRFTQCCDEFFVQTFIKHQSEWSDKLYCNNDEYQGCMRLIDWDRGTPYVFKKGDVDEVFGMKRFFIRKVADVSVMNEIEKYREKDD